ncbi:MAG TPA: coenzyme F420-0:L-glutamate ligase [Nitrososphaerales archaeon]|nr:coenzyme F420-0:L-glutamate ligase [Nitrososphaerales archaeon]
MKLGSKRVRTFSKIFLVPIKSRKRFGKFDLGEVVSDEIKRNRVKLRGNDIVVVSSKFAAMSEGRFVDLSTINPSSEAHDLASKYNVDPTLAQLVKEESEVILGGIPGFILAVSKGILAPNAGIDRSNVPEGFAILYPTNPQETAEKLRVDLMKRNSSKLGGISKLGVVLSDSRVTPTRLGTIGIAIAAAGFSPVLDFRGFKDLFGNTLKVTMKAEADELASAAQLVMGEASESVPIVLIRGYHAKFSGRNRDIGSMVISPERCLYIQGLKNGMKPGY